MTTLITPRSEASFVCLCLQREHSYVQLCAELKGSVPGPAPQAASAAPHGLQVGRQELLDVPALLGCQRRLSAAATAQSGPCGDLWRGDCRDVSRLPPGQTRMDRYSAAGAGQVKCRSLHTQNYSIVFQYGGVAQCRLVKLTVVRLLNSDVMLSDSGKESCLGKKNRQDEIIAHTVSLLAGLVQGQPECVQALSAWQSLFPLSVKWQTTPIIFTSSWKKRLESKQVGCIINFSFPLITFLI